MRKELLSAKITRSEIPISVEPTPPSKQSIKTVNLSFSNK